MFFSELCTVVCVLVGVPLPPASCSRVTVPLCTPAAATRLATCSGIRVHADYTRHNGNTLLKICHTNQQRKPLEQAPSIYQSSTERLLTMNENKNFHIYLHLLLYLLPLFDMFQTLCRTVIPDCIHCWETTALINSWWSTVNS